MLPFVAVMLGVVIFEATLVMTTSLCADPEARRKGQRCTYHHKRFAAMASEFVLRLMESNCISRQLGAHFVTNCRWTVPPWLMLAITNWCKTDRSGLLHLTAISPPQQAPCRQDSLSRRVGNDVIICGASSRSPLLSSLAQMKYPTALKLSSRCERFRFLYVCSH